MGSTHANIMLKLLGEIARSSLTEEVKNKPLQLEICGNIFKLHQ